MDESDSRTSPENVIVVGVDGSPHSNAAALWAANEAHRRRADIRVVHAYMPVVGTFSGWEMPLQSYDEALAQWGRTVLARSEALVTEKFPDLVVTTELRHQLPSVALMELSQRALMTVVGAHGSDRIEGILIGSVALRLAAHGTGPVVIVRDDVRAELGDRERPVVVGLDGSDPSDEALSFAFEEASFRGTRLIAVRTWAGAPGDNFMTPYLTPAELEDIDAEQQRLLAEQLAGRSEKYPDVPVHPVVLRGRAAAELLGLGNESDALPATPALLVVGSRGRGGFMGLLLGSVGQSLVAHAVGPVCIVHSRTG